MTSRVDLHIRRGISFHMDFQWMTNYTTIGNVPIDLTNAQLRMMVKHKVEDEVPLADKFPSITNAESGEFSIEFTKEETEVMVFNEAKYDVVVTFQDQSNYIIIEGDLRVSGIITREVPPIE